MVAPWVSLKIMVAIISQCASSSVPMSVSTPLPRPVGMV
jgi:hypothetical protein